MTDIPLERGLEWFYENLREIKKRGLPEEQSHALAFEAGFNLGKYEIKHKILNTFKVSNMEWP